VRARHTIALARRGPRAVRAEPEAVREPH